MATSEVCLPADERGPKKQFGTFDNLEDRREIMILLHRLGDGLPEVEGCKRRAAFLKHLIRYSGNGFADKMVQLSPCNTVDAYFAFNAIVGVLGVDIDAAARLLEEEVRSQK